jgi:hypothetical protein
VIAKYVIVKLGQDGGWPGLEGYCTMSQVDAGSPCGSKNRDQIGGTESSPTKLVVAALRNKILGRADGRKIQRRRVRRPQILHLDSLGSDERVMLLDGTSTRVKLQSRGLAMLRNCGEILVKMFLWSSGLYSPS